MLDIIWQGNWYLHRMLFFYLDFLGSLNPKMIVTWLSDEKNTLQLPQCLFHKRLAAHDSSHGMKTENIFFDFWCVVHRNLAFGISLKIVLDNKPTNSSKHWKQGSWHGLCHSPFPLKKIVQIVRYSFYIFFQREHVTSGVQNKTHIFSARAMRWSGDLCHEVLVIGSFRSLGMGYVSFVGSNLFRLLICVSIIPSRKEITSSWCNSARGGTILIPGKMQDASRNQCRIVDSTSEEAFETAIKLCLGVKEMSGLIGPFVSI